MKFRNTALILFAALACGCSTLPPLDFSVENVGMVENRQEVELVTLTVGVAPKSQQTGRMETDHGFPPIFKEALLDALSRSLIFADEAERRVNLSVRIAEVDAPSAGASMTTTMAAIYEITDRKNGDLLFAEEIRSEGVVPFNHAFVGMVRARESVNRAARNNIADFISKLELADLDKPIFRGSADNE